MSKEYLDTDVLTEARARVRQTFDDFDRVYLSFSAGKDSTVMLDIVAQEARARGRKFGLLLIDLEAQYKLTMDHAEHAFAEYADCTEPYWICLPLHLRNAVSVYEPFWVCWERDRREAWVREMPARAISDEAYFPFFRHGMEFEEFAPAFGEWYSQGKPTACFVGIRADESLNRFRTIASQSKVRHKGYQWTTVVAPNLVNAYPIYDWKTADIWTWHARSGTKYNELYDRMHLAGVPLSHMRICQPYGDDQRRGLWLFHLIEPQTWSRVVYRVNGANGGALYVKEWGNINGYRTVNKPPGHTWQSFGEMLIESMPPVTREHYRAKIYVFCDFWKERGYAEGIPDEADYALEVKRQVPSWRRICKSLLRNDYWCKGLSFTQHKSDAYRAYLDRIKRRMEAEGVQLDLVRSKEAQAV